MMAPTELVRATDRALAAIEAAMAAGDAMMDVLGQASRKSVRDELRALAIKRNMILQEAARRPAGSRAPDGMVAALDRVAQAGPAAEETRDGVIAWLVAAARLQNAARSAAEAMRAARVPEPV